MPITITPAGPQGIVGPWLGIGVESSFIGPLPSGSNFLVLVSTELEPTPTGSLMAATSSTTSVRDSVLMAFGQHHTTDFSTNVNSAIRDGTAVHVAVTLNSPTAVLDSGATTAEWQSTAGFQNFINNQTFGGVSGLQATQLAQAATDSAQMVTNWNQYTAVTLPSLQGVLDGILGGVTSTIKTAAGNVSATLGQLFSGKSLDTLTLTELTAGESCVDQDFSLAFGDIYGLIVRCTTVPAGWPFTAPGDEWSFPDLAVLTLFRGTDAVHRYGIHTRDFEVNPLPGIWSPSAFDFNLPLTPPGYHATIHWAPGVCGHVFAITLP